MDGFVGAAPRILKFAVMLCFRVEDRKKRLSNSTRTPMRIQRKFAAIAMHLGERDYQIYVQAPRDLQHSTETIEHLEIN